jgi:hypothetical protein
MADRHQVRNVHVHAAELLQRIVVLDEPFTIDDDLELPLHHLGGDAFGVRQAAPVERRQSRESLSRQLDRGAPELRRLGREPSVQFILFGAREVAALRCLAGTASYPLGGEIVEERPDATFLAVHQRALPQRHRHQCDDDQRRGPSPRNRHLASCVYHAFSRGRSGIVPYAAC